MSEEPRVEECEEAAAAEAAPDEVDWPPLLAFKAGLIGLMARHGAHGFDGLAALGLVTAAHAGDAREPEAAEALARLDACAHTILRQWRAHTLLSQK